MINISQLKQIDKIITAMKCDLYMIFPNMIIGCDKYLVTLSKVDYITGCIGNYEFTKEIWDKLMEDTEKVSKENLNIIDFEKAISLYYSIKRLAGASDIYNIYIKTMESLTRSKLSMEIDNLKSDPLFLDALEKKASDGMILYKINRKYQMSLFARFLPVRKADKVSLKIYDIIDYPQFISQFNIIRGPFIINKYIKYLIIEGDRS